MADRFEELCKIENLKLAWNRINTSTTNLFYKNYYRNLFWHYEMTIDDNLNLLSTRLKNGTYKFQTPIRFYKPKQNGLQRPFTFLSIEDQIVYQDMANIVIPDLLKRRRQFEMKSIFSNIFSDNPNNNIYLLKSWKIGYSAFKEKIKKNFEEGQVFTAHFDLAAFFDTIDHYSLTSAIMNNLNSKFCKVIQDALKVWSNESTAKSKKITHSIPQGPLASIVFSELFFVSVDEELSRNNINYSRYVDDIVIQRGIRNEVLKNIIFLEKTCKEKGLIPQSSKFQVFKSNSADEAIGKYPSLTSEERERIYNSPQELVTKLKKSFDSNTFDSSCIRYILKTYTESDSLLPIVFKEFCNHFEFVEEFCIYLKRFSVKNAAEIINFLEPLILRNEIPYGFVLKEIWEVLGEIGKYIHIPSKFETYALNKISKVSSEERYGIMKFLYSINKNKYCYQTAFQNKSILQLLEINSFDEKVIFNNNFYLIIQQYERRTLSELKIVLSNAINYLSLISNKTINNFVSLKIPKTEDFETVKYFLHEDYDIVTDIDWTIFFKKDYKSAQVLIYEAHISKNMNKTVWLNLIDSFNDLLVRKFIELLKIANPKRNWPKTINQKNELVDIGNIYKENNSFSDTYEKIAKSFNCLHKRRSSDLLSHAKDKKTQQNNSFITAFEQRKLISLYKPALKELATEIESLL